METVENQTYKPLAMANDQTYHTLDIAYNYGVYPCLYGYSSLNWNSGTIPPYPTVYDGRHVPHCNTHQQQQPEFGFYQSLSSPASLTATEASPATYLESEFSSRIEYAVPTPFHSPPIDQNDTLSSKTFPSDSTHYAIQNQHISPAYSYHSIDESSLQQPVVGNQESVEDLSLRGQFISSTVSSIAYELHCEECNKQFASKAGLTHHKNKLHTETLLFRCEKCGKRFAELIRLQRHILRHVTINKPYKCEDCPKTFNHRGDLRRHQYRHTGDEPYQCSVCSKPFARRDHMRSHELTHRKRSNRVKEMQT